MTRLDYFLGQLGNGGFSGIQTERKANGSPGKLNANAPRKTNRSVRRLKQPTPEPFVRDQIHFSQHLRNATMQHQSGIQLVGHQSGREGEVGSINEQVDGMRGHTPSNVGNVLEIIRQQHQINQLKGRPNSSMKGNPRLNQNVGLAIGGIQLEPHQQKNSNSRQPKKS